MTLSASGARIQGDDYQHLFAWYMALRALKGDEDVTGIAVEAEDAGNVDDVVVRRASTPHEYYQVKYSVDASHPIDQAWWITAATAAGKSPLQRFWESWNKLRHPGSVPHLGLFTNRTLDTSDPVLALRDGQLGRLGPRLRLERPRSDARKSLRAWATHVKASEDDLLEMFDNLDLLTDQAPWSGLVSHVSDRMAAVGLLSDEPAVEQGVSAIRAWVKAGQREIGRDAIRAEVARRNLHGERRATLCVQAIDRDPWATGATVSVDWVDLFAGSHPKERRQLRDPSLWNARLFSELSDTERRIRGLGFDRVHVRGFMRLPTSFATGVTFGDTRGMRVSWLQGGERWGSEVQPGVLDVNVPPPVEIGQGADLAVGMSVSADLSRDVVDYVRASALPVRRFVHVTVSSPGKTALPDAAQAMGWAQAARNVVRDQAREIGARAVHLFLATPAGGALFLGHVWNRVPPTVVYEDTNPGYAPTFQIPG